MDHVDFGAIQNLEAVGTWLFLLLMLLSVVVLLLFSSINAYRLRIRRSEAKILSAALKWIGIQSAKPSLV